MTISRVILDQVTDTWSVDQSQEFSIEQSKFTNGDYIEALGFRVKKVANSDSLVKVNFTTFFAAKDRFYLADFTVNQSKGLIDLELASLSKSFEIPFRAGITRVSSLSYDRSVLKKPWSEFYLFSTTTRTANKSPELVLDGLLISDLTLKKENSRKLMSEPENTL